MLMFVFYLFIPHMVRSTGFAELIFATGMFQTIMIELYCCSPCRPIVLATTLPNLGSYKDRSTRIPLCMHGQVYMYTPMHGHVYMYTPMHGQVYM